MRYMYETPWGYRMEYECDLCRRRFDGEILTVRMGDKQVGDVCNECWQRLGAEEERTREQRQKDYLEHYCCAICGRRIEGNHIKGYEFSKPTRPGNSKENIINDNGYGGYNICMDCIRRAQAAPKSQEGWDEKPPENPIDEIIVVSEDDDDES